MPIFFSTPRFSLGRCEFGAGLTAGEEDDKCQSLERRREEDDTNEAPDARCWRHRRRRILTMMDYWCSTVISFESTEVLERAWTHHKKREKNDNQSSFVS
jgi:hypothetical protein